MPFFVDDSGELWEFANETVARRRGLTPATREDKERHNRKVRLEAADDDNLQTVGEEIKRVGAGAVELASRGLAAAGVYQDATEALGEGPNVLPATEVAPSAFTPEAITRREANPIAAGIGSAVATAPLAALTGGVGGALGRAAATRLGSSALGEAVAGTAVGRAAGNLAGRIGGTAAVGGAAGTIGAEALTEGVVTEYSDAWLEERPVEFGNVVRNTAMAVAGDLLLRGVFKGVGTGYRAARDRLFPGEAAAEVADAVTPGTSSRGGLFDPSSDSGVIGREAARARKEARSVGAAAASRKALDADADSLEDLMPQIRDGKFDKSVALVDTYRDDFTRLAADSITDSLNVVSEEGLDTLRRAKYQNWEQGALKWKKRNIAAQNEGIEQIVNQRGEQIISQIRKAATEVEGIKGRDFKGFEQEIPEFIVRNQRAIAAAEGAERNELVDQFKKGLDNYVNRINASRSLSEADQEYLTTLLWKDEKIGWNNELRKFLEDEAAWGNNAVIQRDVNQEWHKLINPLNIMRRRVMEITGREFGQRGAAAIEREANYGAIKNLISRDNLSNVADYRAWSQALEGIDGIARTYENHGIQIPTNLGQIRDAIATIGQNANRAQLYSVMAKRAENLRKDPKLWDALSGALSRVPVVGRAADLGQVGTNLRDYLVKRQGAKGLKQDEFKVWQILDQALSDAAKNPNMQNPSVSSEFSQTVIGVMREHAKDMGIKIPLGIGAVGAGASLFGTSEAEAAEPDAATPEGAYSRALRDITEAGTETTGKRAKEYLDGKPVKAKGPLSVFTPKKGQSLGEALEARRAQLEAMDPDKLVAGASAAMGQLAKTHPTVYQAVITRVAQLAAYLQREMPPRRGKTPLNPKGYDPTLDEAMAYALKFVGATSPDETLRDIARGQAMPQQVQALKENWGDLYESFRVDLMGKLTALGEQGKTLPVERMRQLDTLLELDGAGNPAMSWKVADAIEAARAAEEQEKPQPQAPSGRSPKLASHYQTAQQAMADLRLNA